MSLMMMQIPANWIQIPACAGMTGEFVRVPGTTFDTSNDTSGNRQLIVEPLSFGRHPCAGRSRIVLSSSFLRRQESHHLCF